MELNWFSRIIEILLVILLLAGVITFFRYPKQIIRSFFRFFSPRMESIGSWIFAPIWLIGKGIEWATKFPIYSDHIDRRSTEDSRVQLNIEDPYPYTEIKTIDFLNGTKSIYSSASRETLKQYARKYCDFAINDLKFSGFQISNSGALVCPTDISFTDFNILIQYLHSELKKEQVYGVFWSESLNYYAYQDSASTHNIIGQTNAGDSFSIYTLDGLDESPHLRMNPQIEIKPLTKLAHRSNKEK